LSRRDIGQQPGTPVTGPCDPTPQVPKGRLKSPRQIFGPSLRSEEVVAIYYNIWAKCRPSFERPTFLVRPLPGVAFRAVCGYRLTMFKPLL